MKKASTKMCHCEYPPMQLGSEESMQSWDVHVTFCRPNRRRDLRGWAFWAEQAVVLWLSTLVIAPGICKSKEPFS